MCAAFNMVARTIVFSEGVVKMYQVKKMFDSLLIENTFYHCNTTIYLIYNILNSLSKRFNEMFDITVMS